MHKNQRGRRKSKEAFGIVYGLQDSAQNHRPKISISPEGLSEIRVERIVFMG